jgi:hypothetical protein
MITVKHRMSPDFLVDEKWEDLNHYRIADDGTLILWAKTQNCGIETHEVTYAAGSWVRVELFK